MPLTKKHLQNLYRKRAANYDFSANLYYLVGFRIRSYRKLALSKLGVKEGDTVAEIGCGTGLNFKHVMSKIGKSGKLIGVDLTDAMLEKAKQRAVKNNWQNVELIDIDAAKYDFPENINAVFSTFALTLVPEYEDVIRNASQALSSDGKLVILDLKQPDNWPLWLVKFGVFITKPFGVSLDIADRKLWKVMEKYFKKVDVQEIYGGFAYVVVGEK